jgi:hypothetical protein
MKKLEQFLRRNNACSDGLEFAKNLSLEEFWTTCHRGDWILWLFAKMNPNNFRELTLAKGHCANTARHLMKDERSTKAVDVAIAFGEGRATRKELDAAADAADAAARAAYAAYAAADAADDAAASAAADAASAADAAVAADAARAAYAAADAASAAVAAVAADAVAYAASAKKQNQKLTADICRKYLPLDLWDLSKI